MRLALLIAAALPLVAGPAASQAPGPPRPTPGMLQRMQAAEAAAKAMPDTPGTGPYPAIKEELASLPDHVVYRPRDPSKVRAPMPIVAWGNGGCSADGAGQRLHLSELASHGYLVIASGTIRSGPGAPARSPQAQPPRTMPAPGTPFTPPPPETSAAQLRQAIDWAIAENAHRGGALAGRLDTRAIAVSGWSCGGVQALTVAAEDPRVRTVVIHNSGLLPDGGPRLPGMEMRKDALARLRAPVIYILGGPGDIAFTNGMDDYARITGVRAMVASRNVGHTGTFFEPNGGQAAQVARHWLDWQLKGDKAAADWFVGATCRLCRDPAWTVQRKGLPGAQ